MSAVELIVGCFAIFGAVVFCLIVGEVAAARVPKIRNWWRERVARRAMRRRVSWPRRIRYRIGGRLMRPHVDAVWLHYEEVLVDIRRSGQSAQRESDLEWMKLGVRRARDWQSPVYKS